MTSAALTAEIQALRAELDAGKHALVLARALEQFWGQVFQYSTATL